MALLWPGLFETGYSVTWHFLKGASDILALCSLHLLEDCARDRFCPKGERRGQ